MSDIDSGLPPQSPSPRVIVDGFVKIANLIESGQYIKLSLLEDPARIITVWIDREILAGQADSSVRDSIGLDRNSPWINQLEGVLALDLYEALTSLSPDVTELALSKKGYFEEKQSG